MSHRMTINVPDDIYAILADITSHTKLPIEEYAVELLAASAIVARDDPFALVMGTLPEGPSDPREVDHIPAAEACHR